MNTPRFDVLESFFHWWMMGWKGGLFPSVHDGITRVGDYTGIVLYRQPPFQVEMWILPPGTTAPEHNHPNVDIFLVHVTGEIKVWVGEELVLGPVMTVPDKDGVTKSNGRFVRIPPGQNHRAESGSLGGAFMNIQLWTDGQPRSTDSDWKGEPLNEEHKKKLADRAATYYVKSLQETSGSSARERVSTLKRAPEIQALLEDSKRQASMIIGRQSSAAGEEKSGQVSLEDKSPARSAQQPTSGRTIRP